MDNFTKAEIEGRQLFKSLLEQCNITEYLETENKYDTMDMLYKAKGRTVGVEIKVRDKRYEGYDTYLMELTKYNALVDKIKDGVVDNACYVNFFGNDTVYIFPIRKIAQGIKDGTIKIDTTYCNKTTAVYSDKVAKQTIKIPKSIAQKFIRVDNKWTNTNKH